MECTRNYFLSCKVHTLHATQPVSATALTIVQTQRLSPTRTRVSGATSHGRESAQSSSSLGNVKAVLTESHRIQVPVPCSSCARSHAGPFAECVIIPGSLRGFCAGCHYGSEGTQYFLRLGESFSHFFTAY